MEITKSGRFWIILIGMIVLLSLLALAFAQPSSAQEEVLYPKISVGSCLTDKGNIRISVHEKAGNSGYFQLINDTGHNIWIHQRVDGYWSGSIVVLPVNRPVTLIKEVSVDGENWVRRGGTHVLNTNARMEELGMYCTPREPEETETPDTEDPITPTPVVDAEEHTAEITYNANEYPIYFVNATDTDPNNVAPVPAGPFNREDGEFFFTLNGEPIKDADGNVVVSVLEEKWVDNFFASFPTGVLVLTDYPSEALVMQLSMHSLETGEQAGTAIVAPAPRGQTYILR